jgi:hypothetical protein
MQKSAASLRRSFITDTRMSKEAAQEVTKKYIRLFGDPQRKRDDSPLSRKLHSITGYYADDYLPKVTVEGGDLLTIIADESEFKGHVGVGIVLLPQLESALFTRIESELESLISDAGITRLHFADFSKRNRRVRVPAGEVFGRYAEIVRRVPLACLAISKARVELVKSFTEGEYSNEELFHSLFWNNVRRATPGLAPNSIVHIYREIENNITIESARRDFDKLLAGMEHLSDYTSSPPSICRHPLLFTKRALFYSSLADLAAYSNNVIQQKIDSGIPLKRIAKNYRDLLQLMRSVFANYSGLASNELIELVGSA